MMTCANCHRPTHVSVNVPGRKGGICAPCNERRNAPKPYQPRLITTDRDRDPRVRIPEQFR